jgi:RNA polymerase sigma-70 factor (ECF subfamily)
VFDLPLRKDRKLKAVKANSVAPESLAAESALENLDAAPVTEAITIADIFNAVPNEDTLEALLDAESDEDFGLPQAAAEKRAVLKEWSAQDFANIYTRFRPHLERHARRFLSNQSQVDEVVQDAFLYLMVTLPELDSELGVLRFMKWKVRLLCLDVIRASGRAYINNIDDIAEPESNEPEVGSELEHIEDAAIVRLALSKLNPRHREVLLASMYEEKSAAEIAAQVGLSENATRQLIFRARAAFKTALLGSDVDTTGMSVSAILSVAARKAAAEAKKVGAQAMVLVLFLMVAVGAVVSFNNRGDQASTVAEGSATAGSDSSPTGSSATSSASSSPSNSATASATGKPSASPSASASASASATASAAATSAATPIEWQATSPSPAATPSQSPFTNSALNQIYSADPTVAGAIKSASLSSANSVQVFDVYDSVGSHARLEVNNATGQITSAVFDFTIQGKKYFAYLNDQRISATTLGDGSRAFTIAGVAKLPFDAQGKVWDQTPFAGSAVQLNVVFEPDYNRISQTVFAVTAPKK